MAMEADAERQVPAGGRDLQRAILCSGLSQGAESWVAMAMLATSMKPQGCGKGRNICQTQAARIDNRIGAILRREERSGSHSFHQPMDMNTAPK